MRESLLSVVLSFGVAMSYSCSNAGAAQFADKPTLVHTFYGSYDLRAESIPELAHDAGVPHTEAAPRIVQFNGRIQPAWRAAVTAQVQQVRGYLPDNALLVMADAAQVAALQTLPYVAAVQAQPRLLRVDPRLVQTGSTGLHLFNVNMTQDVAIELSDSQATTAVTAAIARLGGAVVNGPASALTGGKVLHARLSGAATAALLNRTDVITIEKYFPKKLFNDTSYGIVQAGTRKQSPVWDHGIRGRGQIVAFADTGLAIKSCFFSGADKVAKYEDLSGANDGDKHGHGSHVAGSIAGDNFGNGTYDKNDGMAPAAQLYVQDIAAGGSLTGIPEDLGTMYAAPYEAGARIHSNSWGDDDNTYNVDARAVDTFVAAHRDFLIMFAAGNSGPYDSTVGSPATAKNLISVGALEGSSPQNMADFSSHGPTADGRLKPTLSVPGVDVVSAKYNTACGTTSKSGTSMATPTAAGTAALAREYFTDGFYPTGEAVPANALVPSAALLKATLIASTDNMTGSDVDAPFPSNGQGFGRINLANALYFPGRTNRLWVRDEATGLEQGESKSYTINLQAGGDLKVVLTWSDAPGIAGAANALVNDLNLVVTGPEGQFLGNLMKDGASIVGDMADKDNVEEMVLIRKAGPGTYTVAVQGNNIPMGPQPYAVSMVGRIKPVGVR